MSAITVPVITVYGHVRSKFQLRIAEWHSSIALGAVALLLAGHPDMFAKNDFFKRLEDFAPQTLWVVFLFAVSGVRIAALLINGSWRGSPRVRAVGATASGFVWLELVYGLRGVGHPTLGVWVYGTFILADAYSAFKAGSDAHDADKIAKSAIEAVSKG